jgi:TIR domain-containing protein
MTMAEYDFFISYKWEKYSEEARELAELLRSHDYTAWLDVDHFLDTTSYAIIAKQLSEAMKSCRYVIFFETYTKMAAVKNGTPVRVVGWQERELTYADARRLIVLYHGHDPSRISLGLNRSMCPYHDLKDALEQIESAVADPDLFTSQRSPCGGDGGDSRIQTLADARSILDQIHARAQSQSQSKPEGKTSTAGE